MRVPRIFSDRTLAEGGDIALEAGAARHLLSVLRLRPGDALIVFNGRGGEYRARLLTADGKQARVRLEHYQEGPPPSPLRITLAVGLSKGERMDWVIQKAVELGVQRICPLVTERCEVRLKGQRAERKSRHWQAIAESACEQSGQNLVPRIAAPVALQMALAEAEQGADACKLILDPRASQSLASLLDSRPPGQITAVILLSGPEGGFTDAEVDLVTRHGFTAVSLGPRVLRTETAPLAACALLQGHWGDWR